jgi:hypothetical protein
MGQNVSADVPANAEGVNGDINGMMSDTIPFPYDV